MDNESDLRDLNALLNNNIKKEDKIIEEISYVSYWFGLRVDQITEMRSDVDLPRN